MPHLTKKRFSEKVTFTAELLLSGLQPTQTPRKDYLPGQVIAFVSFAFELLFVLSLKTSSIALFRIFAYLVRLPSTNSGCEVSNLKSK